VWRASSLRRVVAARGSSVRLMPEEPPARWRATQEYAGAIGQCQADRGDRGELTELPAFCIVVLEVSHPGSHRTERPVQLCVAQGSGV